MMKNKQKILMSLLLGLSSTAGVSAVINRTESIAMADTSLHSLVASPFSDNNTVYNYDTNPDKYTMTFSGNNATIMKYEGGMAKNLIIPAKVSYQGKTYTVTQIGDPNGGVFQGKQLTSVTLPDTLTKIGFAAFENNHLTSINLPDSLTDIDQDAFGLNEISDLVIPKATNSIGTDAFYGNPVKTLNIQSASADVDYDGAFNKLALGTLSFDTSDLPAKLPITDLIKITVNGKPLALSDYKLEKNTSDQSGLDMDGAYFVDNNQDLEPSNMGYSDFTFPVNGKSIHSTNNSFVTAFHKAIGYLTIQYVDEQGRQIAKQVATSDKPGVAYDTTTDELRPQTITSDVSWEWVHYHFRLLGFNHSFTSSLK